jgi:hypothetical protein
MNESDECEQEQVKVAKQNEIMMLDLTIKINCNKQNNQHADKLTTHTPTTHPSPQNKAYTTPSPKQYNAQAYSAYSL